MAGKWSCCNRIFWIRLSLVSRFRTRYALIGMIKAGHDQIPHPCGDVTLVRPCFPAVILRAVSGDGWQWRGLLVHFSRPASHHLDLLAVRLDYCIAVLMMDWALGQKDLEREMRATCHSSVFHYLIRPFLSELPQHPADFNPFINILRLIRSQISILHLRCTHRPFLRIHSAYIFFKSRHFIYLFNYGFDTHSSRRESLFPRRARRCAR